ncbi:MAG TPA: acyl-CoA synthetase FdrA [Candidatus Dormibacteraeota bacterium]|jgi:FdrA protein|nr:acyl-CoA synthetase FdrA [Candidatus Dormibacteraeota bacterium]
MAHGTLVARGAYHDSVVLLTLARALRARPGVRDAAALMGTPANRDLLAQAGLLTPEAETAGPNELVVVIAADSDATVAAALALVDPLLAGSTPRTGEGGRPRPRTLATAARRMPEANLTLISVPGAFAAVEARAALRIGTHVMLWSDNVSLEEERRLKRDAAERGLLLMGPDCGTAYVAGVGLGFANEVERGPVGIVAASGTGLQQVATLLAARGHGLSHGLGVGGRDMGREIGGIMTLAALELLGGDEATRVIVVLGKPPAAEVRAAVRSRLAAIGKPAVVCLLGRDHDAADVGGEAGSADISSAVPVAVSTLEDAALAACALLEKTGWRRQPFSIPDAERRIAEARRTLTPGQSLVVGLYAGGTLAHESLLILDPLIGPIASNLAGGAGRHRLIDLGADEFTVGRAHPMLDPGARVDAIREAAARPEVAVLLLDVVLGHGAAADPAGDLADALRSARAGARAHGRGLVVVATVVGTARDPQGLAAQIGTLEAAGAWVLPSNAQAARAAACIAGGDAVRRAVLGGERP